MSLEKMPSEFLPHPCCGLTACSRLSPCRGRRLWPGKAEKVAPPVAGSLRVAASPLAGGTASGPAKPVPRRSLGRAEQFKVIWVLLCISVAGSEVGPDHVLVVAYFVGGAVADFFAVV